METQGFEKKIASIESHLAKGEFRAADVKKMSSSGFYRAKLDKENRLLFSIASYDSQKVILLLELIRSHRYDRSRFLKGKRPSFEEIDDISPQGSLVAQDEIRFFENQRTHFHFLNKPIVFDREQDNLLKFPFPCIVVGSAGSGKTAISLEKMKDLSGDILYVTLSSYLAENSRDVYYACGYSNERQNIDFLSFYEFLESFAIPDGDEISFREFRSWFSAQKIKNVDAHEIFEEFKGVLTGVEINKPYLSREEYLSLGVKQSIFPENQRDIVYDVFLRYLLHLRKKDLFDLNILSYSYLDVIDKKYDYLIVDEIQDFTNIQIYLLLKTLKSQNRSQFLFCGDSNQIVHPNFFSWSHLKSLFFKEDVTRSRVFNILQKNYRSSINVTKLANKVLLIKNSRFGSIDKESNYLISPIGNDKGKVELLSGRDKSLRTLDKNTSQSTKFAVLVLHDQDKDLARQVFKTPLLFSIREVKGLEYENIILFNFVSKEKDVFEEIIAGVRKDDLSNTELSYRRAKNKSDKSLERYKFFINSLYVAISRSTKNIFWIEDRLRHPLLGLLELQEQQGELAVKASESSQEEWQREAQRLAKQGKDEQAEAIRSQMLKIQPTPWTPYSPKDIAVLAKDAYEKGEKQAQRKLLSYGVFYHDPFVYSTLRRRGYKASTSHKGRKEFAISRFCKDWMNERELLTSVRDYGIDYRNRFDQTPLMGAASLGRLDLVDKLLSEGARADLTDFAGRSAFDIATSEALACPDYMSASYPRLCELLAPGSIKIRVDNKLIKVDRRLMEFTLISVLKVSIWHWLSFESPLRPSASPTFRAADIVALLAFFPDSVIPERRKKRTYISSMLSKNEVDRDYPYNRKLFLRSRLGCYFLNPRLDLWVDDKWTNLYSLLGLERFAETADSIHIKSRIERMNGLRQPLARI